MEFRRRYPRHPGELEKRKLERPIPVFEKKLKLVKDKQMVVRSSPDRSSSCCRTEKKQELQAQAEAGLVSSCKSTELHDETMVRTFGEKFVNELTKIRSAPFRAGALCHATREWEKLTPDYKILRVVTGLTSDFIEKPTQSFVKKQLRFSRSEQDIIDKELEELIAKGVIEIVEHEQGEFISHIFTREKKESGKHRVISVNSMNI